MLMRTMLLKAADSPSLRSLVETRGWFFAKRFVAGQTLDEAVQAVRELNAAGARATVAHLGEHISDIERVRAETDASCEILARLGRENLRCGLSLKLSHLGMGIDDAEAERNTIRVAKAAADTNRFLRIDMEESAVVDTTLRLFQAAHARYPNVGIVIQAYLRRSLDDVNRLNEEQASVRLCKGAYMEPASVAFQEKSEVDRQYVILTRTLLHSGYRPAIATHDPAIITATKRAAAELKTLTDIAPRANADPGQWEFQMLYGIRRDLQQSLVGEGYGVRVYVPYGTEWYPYFMRRLAERPANIAFFLKNLRYR
jgi:proline dehydrogenase